MMQTCEGVHILVRCQILFFFLEGILFYVENLHRQWEKRNDVSQTKYIFLCSFPCKGKKSLNSYVLTSRNSFHFTIRPDQSSDQLRVVSTETCLRQTHECEPTYCCPTAADDSNMWDRSLLILRPELTPSRARPYCVSEELFLLRPEQTESRARPLRVSKTDY